MEQNLCKIRIFTKMDQKRTKSKPCTSNKSERMNQNAFFLVNQTDFYQTATKNIDIRSNNVREESLNIARDQVLSKHARL